MLAHKRTGGRHTLAPFFFQPSLTGKYTSYKGQLKFIICTILILLRGPNTIYTKIQGHKSTDLFQSSDGKALVRTRGQLSAQQMSRFNHLTTTPHLS